MCGTRKMYRVRRVCMMRRMHRVHLVRAVCRARRVYTGRSIWGYVKSPLAIEQV